MDIENSNKKPNKNEEQKRTTKISWLILFLINLSQFSQYYCFDMVTVLHSTLKEKFKKLDGDFEYYYNLMYSVYSFPNIILPFLAGLVITKFGNNCMLIFTTFLVTVGQIFFTIGILNENIIIVLVGRLLFGLGGESNGIPLNSLIIKWFDKSNSAFSLGLNISGGRIASVLNDILTPYLADVSEI